LHPSKTNVDSPSPIHKSTPSKQVYKHFIILTIGADFLRQLLNPPKPVVHTNAPTYLHNTLTQISFPPNVTILPDKQLERRQREKLAAIKSRQAKIAQQKKEAELLEQVKKEIEDAKKSSELQRLIPVLELKKEYKEKVLAIQEERLKKEKSFLGQFYGRWS